MPADVIEDRGRGPEIVGTRITVYNLLQAFLDRKATEEEICRVYEFSRASLFQFKLAEGRVCHSDAAAPRRRSYGALEGTSNGEPL